MGCLPPGQALRCRGRRTPPWARCCTSGRQGARGERVHCVNRRDSRGDTVRCRFLREGAGSDARTRDDRSGHECHDDLRRGGRCFDISPSRHSRMGAKEAPVLLVPARHGRSLRTRSVQLDGLDCRAARSRPTTAPKRVAHCARRASHAGGAQPKVLRARTAAGMSQADGRPCRYCSRRNAVFGGRRPSWIGFWMRFRHFPDKRLNISSKCRRQKRKRPCEQGLGNIVVERRRIELPTFALRTRRSPS